MSLGCIGRLLAGVALLLGGLPLSALAQTRSSVLDLPVEFSVVNKNDSAYPCPNFDNLPYTVRGSLVAPRSVLVAPNPAVTLYLHGTTFGEFQWHLPELRAQGYDFAFELATRRGGGHASVVIDQLGYGRSDHPSGYDICVGGLADIAYQIITQLRAGGDAYVAESLTSAPAFERVAIAGNSMGGLVAQIEEYSFHGADALIAHGINNLPITLAHAAPNAAEFFADCQTSDGGVGNGYGYASSSPELERVSFYWDIDDEVWEVVRRHTNPDSCANQFSEGEAIYSPEQSNRIAEIDVPVLIVAGAFDLIVGPTMVVNEIQRARMTGSPEVTVVTIPSQGHVGQFERTSKALQQTIEAWLENHGF